MTRRIAVLTGTRAEYGLLRDLLGRLQDADDVDLSLIVTGMHLSPEFGMTVREIEADGFPIADRVEMLLSADSASAVTKAVGLGLIGFADVFARRRPDLLVLLGDRFEVLAAASAALIAGIPIAHLHGGETTEGAFDEAIRHAVTKMAHLHCVAAAPYRDRVIQLGEAPDRVFEVGALGVDAIHRLPLLGRDELERALAIPLAGRLLVVTFHPATLEPGAAGTQTQALLDALDQEEADTSLIFTLPNADTGGREITRMIEAFVARRDNAHVLASLGHQRYFSLLALSDGVVGNSSSGLIEAPALHVGTVNIGDRQAGRLRADSVISCAATTAAIAAALRTLRSPAFARTVTQAVNPYGQGGATDRVLDILRGAELDGLLKKRFHDTGLSVSTGVA